MFSLHAHEEHRQPLPVAFEAPNVSKRCTQPMRGKRRAAEKSWSSAVSISTRETIDELGPTREHRTQTLSGNDCMELLIVSPSGPIADVRCFQFSVQVVCVLTGRRAHTRLTCSAFLSSDICRPCLSLPVRPAPHICRIVAVRIASPTPGTTQGPLCRLTSATR